MTFHAAVRQAGDITVIDVTGRMSFGESGALHGMIRDLVSQGRKKILLNLGELSQLDSAGVGELVGSYSSVKKEGGELKMVGLKPRVEEILKVARTLSVIEDYSDEQSALRSFR